MFLLLLHGLVLFRLRVLCASSSTPVIIRIVPSVPLGVLFLFFFICLVSSLDHEAPLVSGACLELPVNGHRAAS